MPKKGVNGLKWRPQASAQVSLPWDRMFAPHPQLQTESVGAGAAWRPSQRSVRRVLNFQQECARSAAWLP